MAARSRGTPLLFPGYLFVWIELQWHTARWAPGVVRLVMNGVGPATVPDGVITDLKGRETGGLIDLPSPPKFRAGDRVRILHGPFAGHVGLYAGMRPHERVEVLLAILGGAQRVTLPVAAVEAP
jgi:transcriptional antiterminator RfaH